jgi:hypothetical protein
LRHAKSSLRGAAVVLLVAALGGCGDDGDDNGPDVVEDAGTDAGDAQAPGDAGGDAGSDGGTDAGADAGTDAGDAGTDAGNDAGTELSAALDTNGVRTDRRRAELIAPAFCQVFTTCPTLSPYSIAECPTALVMDYDRLVVAGDSPACIDATLDFGSCIAGATCDNLGTRCAAAVIDRDTRCMQ